MHPAFTVDYITLTERAEKYAFSITVKPTSKGYKIKTKNGFFHRSTTRVENLNAPVETGIGTIRIHANRALSQDTIYQLVHRRRELVVAGYGEIISIAQYKKESNIIRMSMQSTMPDRDKALLNQLIEQYNLNAVVDKNMIATNTANFIEERLAIISKELADAENAVADYKESNNIADIQTQAQLFLSASSAEQRAMAEIETQLSLVEYIDEFLQDETKRNSLIPSNIGVTDASLSSGLSEYNALLLQRMRILRTATDDNPVIEQMNAQLAIMRQNIIATIGSVRESLKIRQRNLLSQDSKYNRKIKDAPEQQREYVLLCIFLGLLVPAAVLYLYVLINDKIDDPKEFETRIHAPLLGQLVQNSRNAHIAIHEGESTVSAELFRLIRTNLRYVIPSEVKAPVILVTSCINGDGKSYVSSNTALSLAILGKKVALVGLDIRKPMLASYFGLSNKGHLTDYLADPDVALEDIIVPSGEHPNLDIIPCGTVPPNPAELLQTERVDGLFAELRKRYDYILVDTAPVALVSDTYLLDRVADVTIFVCRYKYTPSEMIEYINNVIAQNRMHNVTCVLNGVKGLRAGYGYGYGAQKD